MSIIISPFKINAAQARLDAITTKLAQASLPEEPAGLGWSRGTSSAYMSELLDYWRTKYDWRAQEAMLNQYPQFMADIDGQQVHFVHIKGTAKTAKPLLLTHGWPDSIYRFYKVIPLLSEFDLVIPSLPGFGFSQAAHLEQTPDIWAKLMASLGYEQYFAAGGDIGATITKKLAQRYPQNVTAIHLTEVGLPVGNEAVLQTSEVVRNFATGLPGFLFQEGAFLLMQGSKPQTLAFALNDSPLGYAAWVTEKFNAWTDNNGNIENQFSKDELLTHIMLYLVSDSVASSLHTYYEWTKLTPTAKIETPTAVAQFPKEPIVPPREWVESCVNLQRYTVMANGGHFPAWEAPELYANDIKEFFQQF